MNVGRGGRIRRPPRRSLSCHPRGADDPNLCQPARTATGLSGTPGGSGSTPGGSGSTPGASASRRGRISCSKPGSAICRARNERSCRLAYVELRTFDMRVGEAVRRAPPADDVWIRGVLDLALGPREKNASMTTITTPQVRVSSRRRASVLRQGAHPYPGRPGRDGRMTRDRESGTGATCRQNASPDVPACSSVRRHR
jgi:hypothetical protein